MRKFTVIVLALVFIFAMSTGAMANVSHDLGWKDDDESFKVKFKTPKPIKIEELGKMDFGTVFEKGATAVEDFHAEVDSNWNGDVWVCLDKKLKIKDDYGNRVADVKFKMNPKHNNASPVSLPSGQITPGKWYDIKGEITKIKNVASSNQKYTGTATLTVSYFNLN